MIYNGLRRFARSWANLVFPPLCVHCREDVENDEQLLCLSCLDDLELIDPTYRCQYCFSEDYCSEQEICNECSTSPLPLNGIAAAFDYLGPAASLIRQLKYGGQTYLAKGCGAYLGAQFLRLEWPLPDLIVPVPMAFSRLIDRGFNQSRLLADTLSSILERPVKEVLVRRSGDYSQAGLSRKQRCQLDGENIQLQKGVNIQKTNILLIDDVMTTGSTMRKCAETLLEQSPASLYGLTFCRAI